MAAALLARHLAGRGEPLAVRSAGMLRDGDPAPPEVVAAMAGYGADLRAHRSQTVRAADLAAADLVLGMAREHVRHAVVAMPEVWPRAFTLRELIRRGEQAGPRAAGEPLTAWLSRAGAGRQRVSLLGDSSGDDVADPVGGPPGGYARTAAVLDALVSRLAELCWGQTQPHR